MRKTPTHSRTEVYSKSEGEDSGFQAMGCWDPSTIRQGFTVAQVYAVRNNAVSASLRLGFIPTAIGKVRRLQFRNFGGGVGWGHHVLQID